MKYAMTLLAFATISSAAHADNLVCSSADSSVRLDAGASEGGPGPAPGHRVRWSDITIDNVKHEDVSYTLTQKKLVSKKTTVEYAKETFVATLKSSIKTEDGEILAVKSVVLCDSQRYVGPPRP
jgi:hypothetical protein